MTRHFASRDFEAAEPVWQATAEGHVVIEEGGRPSYVVLSWSDYQSLQARRGSLADLLTYPGLENIDLDELIGPRVVDPRPDPFADE